MGKLLQFGRNKKNYKLPVGKTAAKSTIADTRKALREGFTDKQVSEIEKELQAEVQAEAEQNE